MKLKTTVATALTALITSLPLCNTRADLTSGLIGYWPFYEGSGHSTVADASFNGGTGTLMNFTNTDFTAMWTTDSKFDNAIAFNQVNETNNYVSVPNSASFDTIAANKKYTLSAWVKLSVDPSLQSNAGIIAKGADGTDAFILFIYQSKFRIRDRISDGSATVAVSSTTIPVVGTWYHVVAVWDNQATTRLTLYVNGVAEGNNASTRTTVYANTHALTIGCRESSATSGYNLPFKGTIEDVRVYNRGLSADEVTQLYNSSPVAPTVATQPRNVTCYSNDTAVFQASFNLGMTPASYQWRFNGADISGATTTSLRLTNVTSANAGSYTLVATNYRGSATTSPATLTVNPLPAVDTTSGLVGWWKMDDASGSSTAADSAGGNAGTLNGFTDANFASMWGDGLIDGALYFNGDGSSANVVAVPSIGNPAPAALDFSTTPVFTLAAWVNASLSQSNQAGIIAKGTGGGGEQYCLDINNAYYRFFVRDASSATTAIPTTGPINGAWQHVAAVVNGINGTMNFYINGALVGSAAAPASLFANTHEVSLGNRQSGSDVYNYPLSGGLDDVRIYSRALTAADVYALYAAAGYPVIVNQYPVTYTNRYSLYAGASPGFRITAVTGIPPFSYQWYSNGVAVAGATSTNFQCHNLPAGANLTNYCVVNNALGVATSFVWTATVVAQPTSPYAQSVLNLSPIGYWRLDETDDGSGTWGAVLHDYLGGNNGLYTSASTGQPGYGQGLANQYGYGALDLETSVLFGYYYSQDSYAGQVKGVDFGSPNGTTTNFTVECWVSGAGTQPSAATILSKGIYSMNDAWSFGVDTTSSRKYRFSVRTADGTVLTATSKLGADTVTWHHLVGVLDEANGEVNFYIDGLLAASTAVGTNAGAYNSSANAMSIGSCQNNTKTGPYSLQFNGNVNDVALYNYALSATQVQSNYLVAGIGPRFTQAPPTKASVTEPQTLTIDSAAFGTPPLTYRWTDSMGSPLLANQTNASLVISNVPGSLDGDNFYLTVTGPYGTLNAGPIPLTVTSGPPQLITAKLPQRVVVPLGKTFTYSVSATGTVPFSYQWYDGGSPVPNQTNASYTAAAPALGTRTISVTVSNSRGSASASSQLTVVAAPSDSYAASILGLQPTPVGYWPLQETAAPAPVSVETNYGTLGAVGTAYYPVANSTAIKLAQSGALTASGDNDSSVTFNGGNTAYGFVPRTSPSLTLQPPITLECWMAPTTTAGTQDVICQGGSGLNSAANSGNFGGFRMSFGSGAGDGDTLQFFAYTGSGGIYNVGSTNIQTGPGSILRNQWNHCVVTYDGTTVLEYVNGQLLASGTTAFAPDTWTPLTIGGGRWQDGAPTRKFTGGLDEVAIYTNVLTDIEISDHYQAGITSGSDYKGMVLAQHPLLYYRMDAPAFVTSNPATYPSAVNYGSAAANGVYQGGVIPGGGSGPAIVGLSTSVAAPINGIFSCVDAGNDPAFNVTDGQPFTALVWFKGNPGDGRLQTLMGHGTNWSLNLDGTSGKLQFTPNNSTTLTTSNIVNDSNWHLATGVYDGTTAYLYVDGAPNVSKAAAGSVAGDPNANLFLGGNSDFITVANNQQYFAGALAQAAFFTNALTAIQVQNIYAAAMPNPIISIAYSHGNVVITYTGTLLSSPAADGQYTPVAGASSPYTVPQGESQRFYRTSIP